jgi:hypothetical protein
MEDDKAFEDVPSNSVVVAVKGRGIEARAPTRKQWIGQDKLYEFLSLLYVRREQDMSESSGKWEL